MKNLSSDGLSAHELPGMNLPVIESCSGCGACCVAMGHPHFYRHETSHDPHWMNLPDHLKQQVNEYVDSLESMDLGSPCIWYDPELRNCRHYEHRPQMCRDFEMGSMHCHRKRQAEGIVAPIAKP